MRVPVLAVYLWAAPLMAHAQAAPTGNTASENGGHEAHGAPSGQKDGREVLTVMNPPRGRSGPGTAWQPDSTPHAGQHWDVAGWDVMLHGVLFGGYDVQGGPRGSDELVGLGWVMGRAERAWSADRLRATLMLSPEPFTAGTHGGYPLLLQTGEVFQGEPLIDRQHPHDLFMEASLTYTHAFSSDWAVMLYAAPSGEPALGPVAFPHRQSAFFDPMAPLGHHWQDSSHIAFGVLTAGVLTPTAKLEVSWFNGREPDEHRYDFDLRRPDSFSVRLTSNPTRNVSAQVSFGHLASPEQLAPGVPVTRLTASVMYGRPLGSGGYWATTAIYGYNLEGGHERTGSALLESSVDLDGKNVLFGRVEYVQKTGHALALPEALHEEVFGLGSLALGYVRNLGPLGPVVPGVGVRGAINSVPSALVPFYGSRTPVGGMVYLRLASAPMKDMGHEDGMGGMSMH